MIDALFRRLIPHAPLIAMILGLVAIYCVAYALGGRQQRLTDAVKTERAARADAERSVVLAAEDKALMQRAAERQVVIIRQEGATIREIEHAPLGEVLTVESLRGLRDPVGRLRADLGAARDTYLAEGAAAGPLPASRAGERR